MKGGIVRTALAALAVAAACGVVSPRPYAARTAGPLESFVARAANVDDPAAASSPVEIMIERWSTDKETETLGGTLVSSGPGSLLPTLQQTWQRAGVVLTPGIIGAGARARTRRARNLMFAREIVTANGRQVIVAADQHLALGELPVDTRALEPEFTLLDIRFGPDGKGIGKVAAAASVAYNKQTRVLEVADYPAQPARLFEVRSEKP